MRYTKFLYILIFLFGANAALQAENSISTDITGQVTTVYAVNFDYLCSGLDTVASVGINIGLHNGMQDDTSAYGSVYGFLKIRNLDLFQYTTARYLSADPFAQAWETEPITNTTVRPPGGVTTGVFNPSLEAKLIMGKLYLRFDNGSTLTAERDLDGGVIPYLAVSGHDVQDMDSKQLASPTGVLAFGYLEDFLRLEIKVASQAPGRYLTEATANRINLYNGFAFGVDCRLEPMRALSVELGSYLSLNYRDLVESEIRYVVGENFFTIVEGGSGEPGPESMLVEGVQRIGNPHFGHVIDNPLMVGVKVAYELPLTTRLNLRPFLGGEFVKHNNSEVALENFWEFEAGGGAELYPADASSYGEAAASVTRVDLGDAFRDWTGIEDNYIAYQGVSLYLGYLDQLGEPGYATPRGWNAKLTAFNDGGERSLLRRVGLGAIILANNIFSEGGNLNWGLGAFINTTIIEHIIPFFYGDLWMGDYLAAEDNLLQLNLGAEFTFIPNALLSCRYSTGNLLTLQAGELKWGELLTELKIEYK